MSTTGEQARNKLDLWREYRQAFQEFARTVEDVESLKGNANPSPPAIEAALLEREKAYARYEKCRDALAAELLSGSPRRFLPRPTFSLPQQNTERVKEIAELLWEFEHRREGKADDDWFRAENIFRRAMAGESVSAVAGLHR